MTVTSRFVVAGSLVVLGACGAGSAERLRTEIHAGRARPQVDVVDIRPPATDPSQLAFRIRQRIALSGLHDGSYVPYERASVALDARRGRVFVATSRGTLFAYAADGTRTYRRSVGASVESAPLVDPRGDRVYVGTAAGRLHALRAVDGEPVWDVDIGQPVTGAAAMNEDTLFLSSDSDVVTAVAREDGAVLWTYRRPASEELTITGHAGVTLHEGTLLAGFNDGVVAGISALDGSVLWEIDTSVDLPVTSSGLPRMRDIDTTPVVVDGAIYVASFAGGLYALDANNGSVLHRDETWTGIVWIEPLPNGDLFLASADRGYARFDPRTRRTVWTRRLERGSPSGATYVADNEAILYGESLGSLIAVSASDGVEVARFESGYGFGAAPVVAEGVVAALSNTATLYLIESR